MIPVGQDLSNFDQDHVTIIKAWTDLVADLIAIEPQENPDRLHSMLNDVATGANDDYAKISGGEDGYIVVRNHGLSDEVKDAFVQITVPILLACQDGPLVAAKQLDRTIDHITGAVIVAQHQAEREDADAATQDS